MASDGATSELPNGDVGDQSALEDVVLDSSRTLMSAHPDEFGTKLRWTLGSVAEAFGADRCGSFEAESTSNGSALVLGQEWTAEGIAARSTETTVLDQEAYPWLFERLQAFQNAVASPPADLPAEAVAFREMLDGDDVRSAVYLPLVSDWTLLGAVGFEAVHGSLVADEPRVTLLRTFGDMLGHALAQARRERELRRKNERLEEFASVVSHDLRNPLNVVQASIEFARQDSSTDHLERGAEAAGRMARIIEQVLTLARIGQDIGETEPVVPGAVAREAWDSIHSDEATLEVVAGDTVVADRDRLKEAVENLFRNAIEHGGDDVAVRVGTLPDESGFYVADDGSGIPETVREQVFEQGFSTGDAGTGLGLSIVSRIVDAHGWEIDVRESDAGGDRFEVRTETRRGTER